MNYLQLKSIEKRWNGYIIRSKKAYERNDSRTENKYADLLEKEIKEINKNIEIDWPGLNPCFKFNGIDAYDVEHLLDLLYDLQEVKA